MVAELNVLITKETLWTISHPSIVTKWFIVGLTASST